MPTLESRRHLRPPFTLLSLHLSLQPMSSTPPLRVVTTLPDLQAYRDRVLPLIALSERPEVSLVYLLTTAGQDLSKLQPYSKLKVIEAPRRGYLKWLARWLIERLEADALEVVHDCFGHLAAAFEKTNDDRKYALLTVQYTTNWGWFRRVRPLGFELNARYAFLRARSLWLDARVTRAADRVVVLGPGHERDLIEGHGLAPARVTVIPAEIDAERFKPLPVSTAQPTSSGPVRRLLYTGALSRNKGLDLLLRLFEALIATEPSLSLTLIGRVPPFEARWVSEALSRSSARAHIEVIPALPQDELIQHYQRADLYLFPSRFEGAPRSLREALACGCICVSADLPGCRGADPEAHFIHFASTHSLDAWLSLTRRALLEPALERQERSARGVARMRSAHSPQAVADRYLSLYQELIEERRLARAGEKRSHS